MDADELPVEQDHVAHDQDGLMIEDNGGEDWIDAGFGIRLGSGGETVRAWVSQRKEQGAVGAVDVEEVALVGDESVVAELVVEGKGDSLGLVVLEEGEEPVLASLEVCPFALQESVLQRGEGDEAEEHKAGEGDQEVEKHELRADGEGAHHAVSGPPGLRRLRTYSRRRGWFG